MAELTAENLYLRKIIWHAKAVLVESVVKIFTGEDETDARPSVHLYLSPPLPSVRW